MSKKPCCWSGDVHDRITWTTTTITPALLAGVIYSGLEEVRGWTPSSDKISVHCAWWGYRMRVFLIFDFFVRVSSDWCAGLKLDPTTYDEGPG